MIISVRTSFTVCIYIVLKFVTADPSCSSVVFGTQEANTIYNLMIFAGNILDQTKRIMYENQRCAVTPLAKPMDCAEIYENDKNAVSGIYDVWPRNRLFKSPIQVYCDMDDDGGAWTLIQRRGDFDSDQDYFYKDWETYKKGFGDLLKDFYLGNDAIFALTNQRENSVKFVLSDWEGNTTYATYDEFWIDDVNNNFTMHVKGYRGTAGDSFSNTDGVPFTTKDVDNDFYEGNCAVAFKGAWWYTRCHTSNLNGLYLKGPHDYFADGVEWKEFRGYFYSLKDTFIKIRPTGFNEQIPLDATP